MCNGFTYLRVPVQTLGVYTHSVIASGYLVLAMTEYAGKPTVTERRQPDLDKSVPLPVSIHILDPQ